MIYRRYSNIVKKASIILITIFLILIIYSVLDIRFFLNFSFENSSSSFITIAGAVYIWILFSSFLLNQHHLNFYFFFILFTIPFYFGGQLLILLGFINKLSMRYFSIVDGRIPNEFQFQAMKYILLSLLFLHIGYVLVLSINNRENRTIRINNVNNTTKILALRKVALVIFFVTLIPMLLRMGHSISLASSYGHLVYRSLKANEEYLGGWFYISYITGWFIPACYMLLITATTNKQKNIGLVIIGIYCVLYLFTGSRYQLIEIVTSVLLIQIYWHKIELTSRTVFKYLIFSILILIVLKGVGYTRDLSTGTQLLTIDNVKTIFKSGLIYEVLSTTSTTFTTISNAIYHCPTTINYNCGLNLLGSIAYIFPRFLRPSWINMINVESVFSPLYYGWTISGYGSSFLAEAYYNYGYFSYIVMIVYGLVLAKICNMIRNSSQKMDPYRIYISIYLCSEIIWAIRSDLYLIPRHMVLYVIIPISFARLIEMKRNKI